MSDSRKILKNIFSLTAAEIATKGIALVFTIYLAKILGPEGNGVIGFAKYFVSFFVIVGSLGLDIYGTREIARQPDRITKYVNSIFSIRLILSAILYAILIIAVLLLNKPIEVKVIILIAGMNIFSSGLLLNWVFQGLERMEIIALRQVITSALNLIGILVFVNSPDDIYPAMIVMSASMLINTAWMIAYYIKGHGLIRFDYDPEFWKKIIKSSYPIGLTFMIVVIYNATNTVMLGFMRSDYETGIYSAAYSILIFALVPTSILQGAFFPKFSRLNAKEERNRIVSKFALLSFLVGVLISFGFFVYSDFVISFFGKRYAETTHILSYLMVSTLIVYVSTTFFSPLLAWKMEKIVMFTNLAGLGINLLSNFILIPKYGMYGAALSSIFSEFTVLIGFSIIYFKTTGDLYLKNLAIALGIGVVSFAPGLLMLNAGAHAIFSSICSIIIFISITLLFKVITINEIRGYFAK